SKAPRVCPSTPPLPRFAFTFSQAISRFFRLYTLSINEWTFFAPVRLIQSTSLLRRECTGFSLMELFLLLAFTHLAFSLFLTIFAGCLPRPNSVAGRPVTELSSRFRCRVGGGALTRWPPSAAQTVHAGFPHTAFTK